MGAHGFVAGEAREDWVFETGDGGARRVLAQFVQQFADDFRRRRVFEQGGNGGDVDAAFVCACRQGVAEAGEPVMVSREGIKDRRGGGEALRQEQVLGLRVLCAQLLFQAFVEDAFVRGMHIDDNEAVRVLREDEDVMDLAEGVAERVFLRLFCGSGKDGAGRDAVR